MKRLMFALFGGVLAGTLLTLGCLIKEEIHTLYLSPDGSVIWTVLEKDVRSDSDDPDSARNEEEGFLDQSRTGEQPAASELRKLGPDSLRTRILREERPFSVWTEARFASADTLARAILAQADVRGDAELQTAGGRTRLVVRFYPPPDESVVDSGAGDPDTEDETADQSDPEDRGPDEVATLTEALKRYKIVLARGKFVESHGFQISEDGKVAYLQVMTLKEQGEADGALVYSLAWTSGGESK